MELIPVLILFALYFTRFGVLLFGFVALWLAVVTGMLLLWACGVLFVFLGLFEVFEPKKPRPTGRKPRSAARS